MNNKLTEKKRGLKLVEKYENGESLENHQSQENKFEHSPHLDKQNIRVRPEGNWSHPGVSGISEENEAWVNAAEYQEQTDFAGYGPKNYKRSDDRIFEDVCETLMKHYSVDATNIGVKVINGVVYLSGKVESRRMKKNAELIIEDLPGVQDVRNELNIIHDNDSNAGPESVTMKDLGV